MTLTMRFAKNLRRFRDERAMSQTACAEKAGLARPHLARLEAGRQSPTLSTVEKLARVLRVSVTELLE